MRRSPALLERKELDVHAKHKYCLQPSSDGRLRSACGFIAQPPQDDVSYTGMLDSISVWEL